MEIVKVTTLVNASLKLKSFEGYQKIGPRSYIV